MTIDYIVTSIKKTKDQIFDLLLKSGLKGNILFGNQCMSEDSVFELKSDYFTAVVYNQTSKGVSANRNFLLKHSKADYVMFLDDDVSLLSDYSLLENPLEGLAFRYNCLSSNKDRPIKKIDVSKNLKFSDLKSYGVWGIAFPREFIVKNDLLFNEYVGPGRYVNHGEDTLYLKKYLKNGGKIYQINETPFMVSQENSTWKDGDVERELLSHGYVYKLIFNFKGWFILHYYCLKHFGEIKQQDPKIRFFKALKLLKKGYHLSEDELLEREAK